MSNAIRYDALLVRALAAELDESLAGSRVEGVRLDPDGLVAGVELEARTLVLELHPERGWIRLAAAPPVGEEVRLPRRAELVRVEAPPDERLLVLRLTGAGAHEGRTHRVLVELMTNQWNVLALDGRGRIIRALRERVAGGRPLRPGARWRPPEASGREGVDAPLDPVRWRELLGALPPRERARGLVRRVAWTSPLNATSILGSAATDAALSALEAAHRRYRGVVEGPAAPCLLDTGDRGPQPYPVPLADVPSRARSSLLEAMAEIAEVSPTPPPITAPLAPATLRRLERALARARARARRLEQELVGAGPEAESLRSRGTLLLARLGEVPRGASVVELPGFDGGSVRVELDPALSPAENARRLFEEARRRERAAERLPSLLAEASRRTEGLTDLLRRVRAGDADETEVRDRLGPAASAGRGPTPPPLPYRRYRTTGGLEVRVGRNRRANDDLTFHHSAPHDVWLHARDAAGAHVVLRWPDAERNPPARDLLEAAVLAALHSRSRTSGTVPVDWTRRKYVRKPRRSPPGAVVPDRVKTLFVEPDEAVERRLRWSGADD